MPTTEPVKKKTIKVPKVVNGVPSEVEIEVDDVAGPTWGDNTAHRLLNTKLPRADGPAKTTGTAIYTYDVTLPGMQFGRFVTSPHARANVKSFDPSAALKLPGVTAVLAVSKSPRYEGDPVAAVCAVTREAADDAVRAVVVEYDVQPFVVVAEDALKPGAPKIFPPGDAKSRQVQGNVDEVDAAFADCARIVDATYRTRIMHHACLETHGVVCDYRGGDAATVYASTQGTFTIPGDAAKALDLKQSNVTAVVQNMGGGFGSKFGIGITGLWGCRLSKQLGVPVKMMLSRREEFLTAGNGPGSIQKIKAGVAADGTLLAMSSSTFSLAGVGRGNIAGQPYQYKAQKAYREQAAVHTNEDSSVAMRAPGFPQASFAIESMMDELAEKIGMDPVQFRLKNVTNDAHRRQLAKGAEVIGWNRRNMKAGAGDGPLKRGFGCGIGAWGGGGGPKCVVNVIVHRDGTVAAEVGSQDLGTGTRTYVKAIVAEELGLEMADVQERIGRSTYGDANASGGSTTAASLAPAVKDAAFNARVAIARLVAPLLGTVAEAVTFAGRRVSAGDKSLDWKQACQAVPAAGLNVQGKWQPGLSSNGAHGASFAEAEVDTETGHVRVVRMCHVQDGGLILNRLATESQINGGMIQSLGMALYEQRVMDARLGVMLNPGFGDYKLPGCLEIPELIPVIDDGDTRQAVIGIAEPANIPGVGAVANAVYNACGVRVRDLPITPDKILNGLAEKKA